MTSSATSAGSIRDFEATLRRFESLPWAEGCAEFRGVVLELAHDEDANLLRLAARRGFKQFGVKHLELRKRKRLDQAVTSQACCGISL